MNREYGEKRRALIEGMITHRGYALAISFYKLLGYDDYMNGDANLEKSTNNIKCFEVSDFDFQKYSIEIPPEIVNGEIKYYYATGELKDNFFNFDFVIGEIVEVIVIVMNDPDDNKFQVRTLVRNENLEECLFFMIFDNCPLKGTEEAGECYVCDTDDYTLLHQHCSVHYLLEDSLRAAIYDVEFD